MLRLSKWLGTVVPGHSNPVSLGCLCQVLRAPSLQPSSHLPRLYMESEEWGRSSFGLGPTLSQSSGDTLWNRILSEVLTSYLTKRKLASGMPDPRSVLSEEGKPR